MKIIIADAKILKDQNLPIKPIAPLFQEKTKVLFNSLKKLEPRDIHDLMNISFKQSSLIYDYYHNIELKPALSLFYGVVFQQLQTHTYNQDDYQYLDNHLCIMSPLYGILRYNDGISYHRLEMKHHIDDINLYDYWKKDCDHYFENVDWILSLTTKEYLRMIHHPHVIHIDFGDYNGQKLKRSAIYLKQARGKMLDYMIKHKIENIDDIKKISFDGYHYISHLSTSTQLVFARQPQMKYQKK